ncbi:TonB-dependent receptor plug domain-containing protein [Candidatus Latescibacterota bacterium]
MGKLFIAGFIVLLSSYSLGYTEEMPTYEMDAVTVTSNRTISSGDGTTSVEVINRSMIHEGSYKNVSEVLRTIPGIYFASESFLGNRTTESSTGPKIRIRGQGAKLLIDGRPMNMTIFGCLINNMLTLDHVERIEISRGSESVLYGSDGLGGVINIITRTPEKLNTGMTIMAGEKGTIMSSLDHENKVGKFSYLLSGSLKRSDGYRSGADYSDESGFVKLKYDITESMYLETSLNMFNNYMLDPGTLLEPQADFWIDIKRRQADITLKHVTRNGALSIKAYHNEGHHIFTDQDGWHSRDVTNGIRSEMVRNLNGGKNRLTAGFDGRVIGGKALVDDNIYSDTGFKFWLNNKTWYRENEAAVFVSDRQTLMDGRLTLTGGGRIVRNSNYGTFFCPKAGIAYSLDRTRFHIGYNRAFKTPSLLQTNLHKKSNPGLRPEISDQVEIGFHSTLPWTLTIGGAVFHMNGTDKVIMAYDNGVPQGFDNIGDWSHSGAEISTSWAPKPYLFIQTGYTILDVGSNTQYNPKHQVNLGIRTTGKFLGRELSLNLNGLGISNIYAANDSNNRLADYIVLDVFAELKVFEKASVVLGLDNILDKRYEAVHGYPLPGRVITAGIRIGQ